MGDPKPTRFFFFFYPASSCEFGANLFLIRVSAQIDSVQPSLLTCSFEMESEIYVL